MGYGRTKSCNGVPTQTRVLASCSISGPPELTQDAVLCGRGGGHEVLHVEGGERYGEDKAGNKQHDLGERHHVRVFPTRLDFLRVDGIRNWDVKVLRRFRIAVGVRLAFSADLLNATNHTNSGAPQMNPANTNSGKVTAQSGAESVYPDQREAGSLNRLRSIKPWGVSSRLVEGWDLSCTGPAPLRR